MSKEELIFWKDNIGGMGNQFPWVKLCWEDFRKFMEQEYPNNVEIKKNGKLMIKKEIENKICKSFVLLCFQYSRMFASVLSCRSNKRNSRSNSAFFSTY